MCAEGIEFHSLPSPPPLSFLILEIETKEHILLLCYIPAHKVSFSEENGKLSENLDDDIDDDKENAP